jgi:hypothetical protein
VKGVKKVTPPNMKVPRKDLVYLFLQAKSNLPKAIIMMMINPVDKKRQRWEEPIHKKYEANKSARTHATNEHSNHNITNTLTK